MAVDSNHVGAMFTAEPYYPRFLSPWARHPCEKAGDAIRPPATVVQSSRSAVPRVDEISKNNQRTLS